MNCVNALTGAKIRPVYTVQLSASYLPVTVSWDCYDYPEIVAAGRFGSPTNSFADGPSRIDVSLRIFCGLQHYGAELRCRSPGCRHLRIWYGCNAKRMANMQALTDRFVPSVKAYILVPIVGSMFADFINSLTITFFINLL